MSVLLILLICCVILAVVVMLSVDVPSGEKLRFNEYALFTTSSANKISVASFTSYSSGVPSSKLSLAREVGCVGRLMAKLKKNKPIITRNAEKI